MIRYLPLLSLLFIPLAYAEYGPPPFDPDYQDCLTTYGNTEWKHSCLYEKYVSDEVPDVVVNDGTPLTPNIDCPSVGLIYDPETGDCITQKDVCTHYDLAYDKEEDTCKAHVEPEEENPDIVEFDGMPFTLHSETIDTDKLLDKINRMLETDAHCYQGMPGTTTAGIQNERSFPIPTKAIPWLDDDGNVQYNEDGTVKTIRVLDTASVKVGSDLRGLLGQIEKYKRECIAQNTLLDENNGRILSSVDARFAYCDTIPDTDKEYIPMCGIQYTNHSQVASNVPIWSQDRVIQESNNNIPIDENPICSSDLYHMTTKDLFGCARPVIEYEGTYANTNGNIYTPSDVEKAFRQYQSGNHESQLEKIQKQQMAKEYQKIINQKIRSQK